MDSERVVSELRRNISSEGRALLKDNNLLRPLVEQMVTKEAIQECPVSEEALDDARQDLLEQRGFDSIEQWRSSCGIGIVRPPSESRLGARWNAPMTWMSVCSDSWP